MPGILYHTYRQLNEYRRSMNVLNAAGFGPLSEPFQALYKARNAVLESVGLKSSRSMLSILRILGLSPGELRLWHDAESGWFTEARATPGSPPVYRHVDDETAVKILKGELSHGEFEVLQTRDTFSGV